MTRDLFAQMQALHEKLAALPPRPRCFMAHHGVPYGRVFRQWNTRGELLVWVNRGEITSLPWRTGHDVDTDALFGIPVVLA